MKGKQQYGVPDRENPEWTDDELQNAKPFAEVFPDLAAAIKRGRGPQKAPRKQLVSMRLDADVLERFRATGRGWQSRINDTLAAHAPQLRRVRPTAAPRPAGRSRKTA